MKCGERVLLPKVREAAKNTVIIADGFSCREQIKSATDRRALHLAQVIKMAMDKPSPDTIYPEKIYVREEGTYRAAPVLAAAGIAAAMGFLVWKFGISHKKAQDSQTGFPFEPLVPFGG